MRAGRAPSLARMEANSTCRRVDCERQAEEESLWACRAACQLSVQRAPGCSCFAGNPSTTSLLRQRGLWYICYFGMHGFPFWHEYVYVSSPQEKSVIRQKLAFLQIGWKPVSLSDSLLSAPWSWVAGVQGTPGLLYKFWHLNF